jgi:citrate lyase subunit beta/citryl-CoA lyase
MLKPIRSLLYVPANNKEWVENSPENYDADAFIYDLEDAVPISEKDEARTILRSSYDVLSEYETTTIARVNAAETGFLEDDLKEIGENELDAVAVPKIESIDDIQRVDSLLTEVEEEKSLHSPIDIIAILETAKSIYKTYEIAENDRVSAVSCGGSPNGDLNRSLGFQWTRDGREKQHYRSKVVLDARAAGVDQLFSGPWTEVDDLMGMREECQSVCRLGYTGYCVIHPSHIDDVNEVFTPEISDLEYYQKMLEGVDESDLEETGVLRFQGDMVDAAHVKTAQRKVEMAKQFGIID